MFSNSIKQEVCIILENTDHVLGILGYGMCVMVSMLVSWSFFRRADDNFRMNTHSGRYGAAYNMVGLRCFNEELSLLPKNPTEAKLQAMSTRGESTEPT
jgi:hypothetical protein